MGTSGSDDRAYWIAVVERLARPVLAAAARRELMASLPKVNDTLEPSRAPTEALYRLLVGIAPWLASDGPTDDEADLRDELVHMSRDAITSLNEPGSPDFCDLEAINQNLVEAAFFAHALLRGWSALWEPLDATAKANIIANLKRSRVHMPGNNNWLLFAAMVEAFLHAVNEAIDRDRLAHAVRQHEAWYLGDGVYGDGPWHHADYYNGFVIHPILIDCAPLAAQLGLIPDDWVPRFVERARRYAAVQERLISPEGTIPVVGRSITYRFGAMQLLGQMALRRELPEEVRPAQVRCGMTALLRRFTESPGVWREDGFLSVGFAGDQPSLAERYISSGSVYLFAAGLLPLGLPPADAFWADAPAAWTSLRLWKGEDQPADHAIQDSRGE